MIKSLRWKLLAWYAFILSGLACIFGGMLYANVRQTMEQSVDELLHTQAAALADVIVPVSGNRYYVELSPEQVEYFSEEGEGASYFGIWSGDGTLVDSSHPSLQIPVPRARGSRNRDDYREVSIRGPADTWVLVGRNVYREREQLRRLTATAVGVGLAAMLLMLVGGWFLTGRALAPIERITQSAASISASNLAERIDVNRMETELAELATTINDAFDRLQQAFEQQTRFTADASHELRTPLSIILSHADLALKRDRSAEEYRDTLATVRRASLRMKRVVEGLLTLARADAGRIQLESAVFDFRQLVEETCSLFAPLAAEYDVALVQDLAPAMTRGDRDRLAEALANLLANAIQYNRPGGRVDVTLRADTERIELRIADTGQGIPAEERPHVFERFYRVDKARSRSVDGSGLGLAITKWIIDAHGGSISCADHVHGGTEFTVRFGAAEDIPAAAPAAEREAPNDKSQITQSAKSLARE